MTGNDLLAEFVTRDELAKILDISPRTIYRYSSRPNGLPFALIGGRVRYRLSSVRKWLESQERQPNPTGARRRSA
ncbi:helix-turn-helix domain-containing protein [Rhizobium sp. LEGMi12c]